MRVFFYAQQLSGVGHFVRTLEIAKQMSRHHEAWMVDGGRPVPRADLANVNMLALPRIHRGTGGLAALNADQPIGAAMAARQTVLTKTLIAIKPDAVVIEHYPFSKWDLEGEVDVILNCARKANPATKIICSVRDIPLQTPHERCSPDIYVERVLKRLHDAFDGVMVHGDPNLSGLGNFFPGTHRIRLPITHTGIVAEKIPAQPPAQAIPHLNEGDLLVIASAGGGADATGLLDKVSAAWRHLQSKGKLAGHKLLLFSGLAESEKYADPSDQNNGGIIRLPFGTDYFHWMQRCQLSISCAGYNTCANILRASCRSILVPNTAMSDQLSRAEILARIGIPMMLPAQAESGPLADAIMGLLYAPEPVYNVALDGAPASERFINSVVNGSP